MLIWLIPEDVDEEFCRLAMGPLLHDVQRKMQGKVDNRETDPLKILVHATHDTTLTGICKTLRVFEDKCVGFPRHLMACFY